jgi:phosphoadenosine phosphosulfate reductase
MNGSIDQYKNMGIRYDWVVEYLEKKDEFWTNNGLGSMMITALKTFLRHAEVTEKNKLTPFGEIISSLGGNSTKAWALMICNLVYTPQFNWWVMNIELNRQYTQKEIDEMLKDVLTDNSRKNTISGFKNIFYSNKILSNEIGFGFVNVEEKGRNTYLLDAYRSSWSDPDSLVILYSLYKFAEKCGEYYQFTLSTLVDDTIERDGISPTRIFGLDCNTMTPILNGLSVNYPEYISASFSLGLDTISLNSEKTSQDVLNLF